MRGLLRIVVDTMLREPFCCRRKSEVEREIAERRVAS